MSTEILCSLDEGKIDKKRLSPLALTMPRAAACFQVSQLHRDEKESYQSAPKPLTNYVNSSLI